MKSLFFRFSDLSSISNVYINFLDKTFEVSLHSNLAMNPKIASKRGVTLKNPPYYHTLITNPVYWKIIIKWAPFKYRKLSWNVFSSKVLWYGMFTELSHFDALVSLFYNWLFPTLWLRTFVIYWVLVTFCIPMTSLIWIFELFVQWNTYTKSCWHGWIFFSLKLILTLARRYVYGFIPNWLYFWFYHRQN